MVRSCTYCLASSFLLVFSRTSDDFGCPVLLAHVGLNRVNTKYEQLWTQPLLRHNVQISHLSPKVTQVTGRQRARGLKVYQQATNKNHQIAIHTLDHLTELSLQGTEPSRWLPMSMCDMSGSVQSSLLTCVTILNDLNKRFLWTSCSVLIFELAVSLQIGSFSTWNYHWSRVFAPHQIQ